MIAFTTKRYARTPLVVQGPGAGADVTAMGVFSDILKLLHYLPQQVQIRDFRFQVGPEIRSVGQVGRVVRRWFIYWTRRVSVVSGVSPDLIACAIASSATHAVSVRSVRVPMPAD